MSQGDKEESSADVDEEELFTHDQPLVRKGLAATIALLQSTGELNKKEKLAGRARDARDINPNDVVKGALHWLSACRVDCCATSWFVHNVVVVMLVVMMFLPVRRNQTGVP